MPSAAGTKRLDIFEVDNPDPDKVLVERTSHDFVLLREDADVSNLVGSRQASISKWGNFLPVRKLRHFTKRL